MVRLRKRGEEIRRFILENIEEHPKDIVKVTSDKFDISRQAVNKHIQILIKQQAISVNGKRKGRVYLLYPIKQLEKKYALDGKIQEDVVWRNDVAFLLKELPRNAVDIWSYCFTEIFNNAIEHSEGKKITVTTHLKDNILQIMISDNGIGIFQKLKNAFHFQDIREGILALSKGKLTTDPEKHTGEGIFFTSKAFDQLFIKANGLAYFKDNLEDDWFVERREDLPPKGTLIVMKIDIKSKRKLKNIFDAFTNPKTFAFNKTHIMVQLCKLKEERYVSRSQAKRLLWGLEKFQHIILDFKNVAAVGQGFVDEVFRVYKNRHPDITIEYINANEDIIFMIKRGVATAENE